jgi:hypothetical protein
LKLGSIELGLILAWLDIQFWVGLIFLLEIRKLIKPNKNQ